MEAKSWSQKLSTKPHNERSCKAPKGQSIMRWLGNMVQHVSMQEVEDWWSKVDGGLSLYKNISIARKELGSPREPTLLGLGLIADCDPGHSFCEMRLPISDPLEQNLKWPSGVAESNTACFWPWGKGYSSTQTRVSIVRNSRKKGAKGKQLNDICFSVVLGIMLQVCRIDKITRHSSGGKRVSWVHCLNCFPWWEMCFIYMWYCKKIYFRNMLCYKLQAHLQRDRKQEKCAWS